MAVGTEVRAVTARDNDLVVRTVLREKREKRERERDRDRDREREREREGAREKNEIIETGERKSEREAE